jgi:hypothetical protein
LTAAIESLSFVGVLGKIVMTLLEGVRGAG